LEQRPIGLSEVSISSIGLGSDMFGGRLDEQECFRILDYALGKGITYLDTAEYYGDGMAERIIGNWMHQRGCRGGITVLTKFYPQTAPSWGNREYIRKALDASLDRLRTDYVDIYMIHLPDLTVPIEETLSTLTEEFEAGRVRAIACSNFDSDQLAEALQVSASGGYQRFAVLQPEYSLAMSPYSKPEDPFHAVGLYEVEDRLFPLCQSETIATTIYSPLAGGFLSGQYARGTPPPEGSRASGNGKYVGRIFTEGNFQILNRLQAKASELGMSVYNLAMAWAMTHPAVTSTIAGARRLEHIDNALEASEIRLDPDLRAEITSWIR
jgi:aryl-alcohol dehydrogenase-like predicted oxidoreductase